jgi:hypothetical protein
MDTAQVDIRKLLMEAQRLLVEFRDGHKELKDLRAKFEKQVKDAERAIEELGAQIEAIADTQPVQRKGLSDGKVGTEDNAKFIIELIRSSQFPWTTIKRLVNKTGLARDEILEIARRHSDQIDVGTGKTSKDHIFRLREKNKQP